MRLFAAFFAALVTLAVAGCGEDDDGGTQAGRADRVRTVARTAHLGRGVQDVRLLRLPGVGRLLVSCDEAGRWSTAFRAGIQTASADVIVERGREVADGEVDPGERWKPSLKPTASGIEHWRIAEFAKAQAAVTTITAGARQSGDGCAISAEARAFESTEGTLTR